MGRLAVVDAPIDCSGAGRREERAPDALRAAGLVEYKDDLPGLTTKLTRWPNK